MISVVVPVKDGGGDLRRLLDALAAQAVSDEVEVIVVDSGSTDGSVELARSRGARVEELAPAEFNHGGARNRGAALARGDVVVFTTQDAVPADERWLERLAAALRTDERCAGVYGRQLPREDALPPERFFLEYLYGPDPREQRAAAPEELTLETTLFSNVNAAIDRSVLERFPFAEDLVMAEGQEWAARVLLAGDALRYEPRAAVWHSHRYTLASAFRRFFDSGASASRGYLAGRSAAARALRRSALRYGREEVAWLWRRGERRWIPYAVAYELAKFAGLQVGARHRRLPLWLKVRLSSLPDFWRRAAV